MANGAASSTPPGRDASEDREMISLPGQKQKRARTAGRGETYSSALLTYDGSFLQRACS